MNTERVANILVATDLSESGREALEAAADLGYRTGATVHVVHAHEEPGPGTHVPSMIGSLHARRRALLRIVEEAVPRAIWSETVRVRVGDPAEVIIAEARLIDADLIVLGPHRKRVVADTLLGSTAEQVIRRATVPCLLVNGPLRLPPRRLLVPTDFTAPARKAGIAALRTAAWLGDGDDSRVTLAHVTATPKGLDGEWARGEIEDDLADEAREMSREAATAIPVDTRILLGRGPIDELLLDMELSNTDLLVIGTHGDPMLVRKLLGSVSSAMVRHAPIPMMLVPPPDLTNWRSRVRAKGREEVEAAPVTI